MIKVTQADIEEVINYALARGITILEIGMSREQLSEYNRACRSSTRAIMLQDTLAEEVERNIANSKFRGGVLITPLEDPE